MKVSRKILLQTSLCHTNTFQYNKLYRHHLFAIGSNTINFVNNYKYQVHYVPITKHLFPSSGLLSNSCVFTRTQYISITLPLRQPLTLLNPTKARKQTNPSKMNKISNVLLRTVQVLALLVLVLTTSNLPAVRAHEDHDISFSKIARQLPVGLSDMTATYIPDFKGVEGNEAIILVGGCADGNYDNTYEENGKNVTNYYCQTISSATYAFYPSTQNIQKVSQSTTEIEHLKFVIFTNSFSINCFWFATTNFTIHKLNPILILH